jgi:hypothetical protein
MAKKKTKVIEPTEEMTEDIEMTDNEDAEEYETDDQDREEFLEDHEMDEMNSYENLIESPEGESEDDSASLIIEKVIEGPWRVRCPFFSYKDESEAREGLELDCSYCNLVSLQTYHDSAADVDDTMQRF